MLRMFAFVVLCASFLYGQAEWPMPNWEKVDRVGCRNSAEASSSAVGKYHVRLLPVFDPVVNGHGCRAYLVDRSGNQTLLLADWEVSIYLGTGEDVFGDGNPSLILEGFSGGARCCYTYRIVNLAEPPVILPTIGNGAPFYFFKAASGQYRIMTSDGAFDSFEGLCHTCTPLPRMVLQVDGAGLYDVSSQFVEQYDSEIALARAKIAQSDIGKFLVADFQDARKVVLEIVFSYLYSGREAQAWQTLDEMWPANDRERVRKLILETRAKGILSKLGKTRTGSIPASYTR